MEEKEQHSKGIIAGLLILLVGISIGYAMLSTTLMINGDATIKKATWDIHFEDVKVKNGSVAINTTAGDRAAAITDSEQTIVEYSVTLKYPGDYYEFTVDAVNDGNLDAKIAGTNISGAEGHEGYFTYSVVWDDTGVKPSKDDIIRKQERRKVRVLVQYKEDIDEEDLPKQDQTLELKFSMNFVQAK